MFRKAAWPSRSRLFSTYCIVPIVALMVWPGWLSVRAKAEQVSQDNKKPCGEFAYVANFARSNSLTGFRIDPATGVWTPIEGSPFPAGDSTVAVAVDPRGRFAYATSANGILAYRIDPQSGALTQV